VRQKNPAHYDVSQALGDQQAAILGIWLLDASEAGIASQALPVELSL
jgi:hypothetical protein